MTTILPPLLGSQLSPGNQMNDTPAESGSRQPDLELLQLVQAIQASKARIASLEMQGLRKEALDQNRVLLKQINQFTRKVLPYLKPVKVALIKQWPKIFDIESIVIDAANNAVLEVLKNIDKFDPDRSDANVVKWIVKILKFRFQDLLRKHLTREGLEESFDNPTEKVRDEINEKLENESEIACQPEPEDRRSKLRKFVQVDLEGRLSTIHIRGNPNATLQKILLMRIEKLTWQEIADRFSISCHSTVSNFHDKNVKKNLEEYFRKNLC